MKFTGMKNAQLGLLVVFSALTCACNPEEYYPSEDFIKGADAYCKTATDLHACQQLGDVCQPAYNPTEDELAEPVFAMCVANPDLWERPDLWDPNYGDAGTVADGSDGSDGSGSVEPLPPTVEETVAAKCSNLENKYLWVKETVKKKKVVARVSKVKVCHMTGSGSSHTIVIACPALKAHTKHGDGDYMGACEI